MTTLGLDADQLPQALFTPLICLLIISRAVETSPIAGELVELQIVNMLYVYMY